MYNFIHHIFVPSHRNNYRARALHLDVLTMLVLVVALASFLAPKAGILGVATDVNVQRLLTRTNEERTNNGLQPLSYNEKLATAAQNKAAHMFVHNYWDHFAPDGTSPWDFITGAGYSYKFAGENLAYNFMSSDDVMNAWKNSSTHWANIVKPEFTEVGFAVMNGHLLGEDTTLVVQMFGTPQGTTVVQQQKNTFVQVAEAKEEQKTETAQPTNKPPTTKPSTTKPVALATSTPTSEPTAVPIVAQKTTTKLSGTSTTQPNTTSGIGSFNLQALKFNMSSIIIVLLLFVLILDMIIAVRLKLIRITGKNLAHIVFLAAIFIGLFIIKKGLIL